MKKIWKISAFLIGMLCIFGSADLKIRAAEDTDKRAAPEMNQVMTMLTDYEARTEPDPNAAVSLSYTAGSAVWVVGQTQNGWYKVNYQGKEGYIPVEYVTDLQVEIGSTGAVAVNNNTLDASGKESGNLSGSETDESVASGDEAGKKETDNVINTNGGKKTVSLVEAGIDDELAAMEAENELLVEEVERQRSEANHSRVWIIVIVLLVIGILATGIISTVNRKGNEKSSSQSEKKDMDITPVQKEDTLEVIDLDKEEEQMT